MPETVHSARPVHSLRYVLPNFPRAMGVGVIMPRQGEATELAGLVSEPGNQMGDGGTLSIWI